MLDAAGDAAPAGTSERALGPRHQSDGDAQAATAGVRQCEDRRADPHGVGAGPVERRRVLGVDLDDGEVAVDVDAGDPPGFGAAVGEGYGDLLAADVVRVGENPTRGDDDAGSDAPALSHADQGRTDLGSDALDRGSDLCQQCHGALPVAFLSSNLQLAIYKPRGRHASPGG